MAPKLWQMVISIGIIVGAWLVSLVLTKILQKLFAKIPWEEGRQKQLLDAVAPSMRFFLLSAGIWFVTQVVALPAWLDDLMSRLMRTLVLVEFLQASIEEQSCSANSSVLLSIEARTT